MAEVNMIEPFYVNGSLVHDGVTYRHGDRFICTDPAVIRRLRKPENRDEDPAGLRQHVIMTLAEFQQPDLIAREQQALRDENADLKQQLADALAQLKAPKSKKSVDAELPATEV